jgi:hypothetical protein
MRGRRLLVDFEPTDAPARNLVRFSRLTLENWRNFLKVENLALEQRVFLKRSGEIELPRRLPVPPGHR